MASSPQTLQRVLAQLALLEDVSFRAMMGEYLLYVKGKVVGGIYDDRLLVKPTASAQASAPCPPGTSLRGREGDAARRRRGRPWAPRKAHGCRCRRSSPAKEKQGQMRQAALKPCQGRSISINDKKRISRLKATTPSSTCWPKPPPQFKRSAAMQLAKGQAVHGGLAAAERAAPGCTSPCPARASRWKTWKRWSRRRAAPRCTWPATGPFRIFP